MRLAIISDIHSNLHALETVLEEIETLSADAILCLGDIVGYGAYPNECCERVRLAATRSILGNHDRAAIADDTSGMNPLAAAAAVWTAEALTPDSKEFISSLKQSSSIEGRRSTTIKMFHGSDVDPDEYVFDEMVDEAMLLRCDADFVLLGHTHIPFMRTFDAGIVANPGSVGQPRDGDPRASFATLDTEKREVVIHRLEYDIRSASDSILEAGLPMMLASRLFVGR